ncbi:alpha/beta hydrolase family protein [Psychrobacter sp. I-STPA10]|uniref:alpha/beta hydrolase family protein n=1 Tax=Psychrobacter sp. I-STPA10 TaxID=2585769 RepID=UPI001E5D1AF2|nr:alpha/beta hydrolase [Psychrobacter sp. I-STPA10]
MTQYFSAKRQFATLLCTTLSASLLLTACGDNDDNNDKHSNSNATNNTASEVKLLTDPVVTQTFTATQLAEAIANAGLSQAVPKAPVCGVTVEYINHTTTGLKGEATNATGALMIPTGEDPKCQGARPISLYAHGTTTEKNYNLAALNDNKNPAYKTALLLAATTAAQGDIVIASNYPGYDASKLDYAPYVTKQQGKQTVDSLTAGKLALKKLAENTDAPTYVTPSDKLFVSGYSQGGYVALATAQALDHQGTPITAVSPGSGPYALAAFADTIVNGNVNIGGTAFLPLLVDSYEAEYGGIQQGIYADKYAKIVPSLLPADVPFEQLVAEQKLPLSQLFSANPNVPELDKISPPSPRFSFGFGDNYLVSTDYRANYVKDMRANPDGLYPDLTALPFAALNPQQPLRKALKENDLRPYVPQAPTLLCGGNQDPIVFFDVNSTSLASIWKNDKTINVTFALLDIDTSNEIERAKAGRQTYISTLPTMVNSAVETVAKPLQRQFSQQLNMIKTNTYTVAYTTALQGGASQEQANAQATQAATFAVFSQYHSIVMPYCLAASQTFFDQYR